MKANVLNDIFKHISFLYVGDYMLSDKLELYDEDDNILKFESVDECLKYQFSNGETISDRLDKIEFEWVYNGGRGSSGNSEMGGGFTSANTGNDEKTISLHPAEFNNQGRFSTPEAVFEHFENKYGNRDREYGLSVDDAGFVYRHVQGGRSSVAISAHGKNHTIIHNHPSGSNFSHADLSSFARDKNAKGIIATGTKGGKLNRYHIVKTNKFDGAKFERAMKKAKWPKNLSYDEGASWWLNKNAKKLGFKFTETRQSANKRKKKSVLIV